MHLHFPTGVTYPLEAGKGGYVMHGGGTPFTRREWEVVATEPQSVLLALESPSGDQGFPGNLTVLVNYTLTDENELVIGAAGREGRAVGARSGGEAEALRAAMGRLCTTLSPSLLLCLFFSCPQTSAPRPMSPPPSTYSIILT